jgi:hypothetical protein
MFFHHALKPAPNPVVYRAGARAIFGYDRFNGVDMSPRTFTDGAVVEFRPDLDEDVTVAGGPLPQAERVTGPVASGEQILWDWPNGRLIIDSPTAKAYVGKPAPCTFSDGIELTGMAGDFIVFAMVSDDGKPLVGPNAAGSIQITAVWNNLNTGYEIDPAMLTRKGFVHPGERMNAVRKKGHAPIIADVVPYTLRFPMKLDYRFEGYDFALRKCLERTGTDTDEVRHDGRELFMGVLKVQRRGEAVPRSAQTPAVPPSLPEPSTPAGPAPQGSAAGSSYVPIPGLSWTDGYASAHRALSGSKLKFETISKLDDSQKPDKAIVLSRAVVLFGSPADIEIAFRQNRMSRIAVSFLQAPPLTEVIAEYETRFGRPVVKQLASQVYGTSTVRWVVAGPKRTLSVSITDHQGTMGITFQAD